MSLYLDKATLPSPCWMMCGSMARVCQDIGLHRQPPAMHFSPIDLESRSRLFWAAYIQDKRVSMKMGRPWILRQDDCNIKYPDLVEFGDNDLAHLGLGENDSTEEPGAAHLRYVSRRALETMRATVDACKSIEGILKHKLMSTDSSEDQIAKLRHLDDEIRECWDRLPTELSSIDLNDHRPFDLASARSQLSPSQSVIGG